MPCFSLVWKSFLAAAVVRVSWWTLARCGHHPFVARTLLHAIRVCLLFDTHQFRDAELLRWIFDPLLVPNNHPAVNAPVHHVATICQAT